MSEERHLNERWTPQAIVVWTLGYGRKSMIHLPGVFQPCGASEGAVPACGPNRGEVATTWTYRWAGKEFAKCRKCFTKTGRPRRRWMQFGGWWTWGHKQDSPQEKTQ